MKVYLPAPDEYGRTDIEIETSEVSGPSGTVSTEVRTWKNPDGSRDVNVWTWRIPSDIPITVVVAEREN